MNLVLPIKISDEAYNEILKIYKTKNIPTEYGLRVGTKGNGCLGSRNPIIGFDKKSNDDETFAYREITIIIEKKDILFLTGLKIDYISNEEVSGFIFCNENLT